VSLILNENRGKVTPVSFPLFSASSVTSLGLDREKIASSCDVMCDLPRCRGYAPGSVGCCTIGLDGLAGLVLVVVVDAAPSSRLKAMIHSIMGASSCLALPFPPNGREHEHKNFACGMRPG
jgi:hypothetical protein